jgi:hypothetical protein
LLEVLKEKKIQNEFINMMPLIAAWQNTQLADFLWAYTSIQLEVLKEKKTERIY